MFTVITTENDIQAPVVEAHVVTNTVNAATITSQKVNPLDKSYGYTSIVQENRCNETMIFNAPQGMFKQVAFSSVPKLIFNLVENNVSLQEKSNLMFTVITNENHIQTPVVETQYVMTNPVNNEENIFDDVLQNELQKFDNFQNLHENVQANGNKTTESEQAPISQYEEEEENLTNSNNSHVTSDEYNPSGSEYNQSSSDEDVDLEREEVSRDDVDDITEPQTEPKKKKTRKGHGNPEEWVVRKNQRRRQEGAAYKGLGKVESGKWKYSIPRPERKLNPPCNCALSKRKSKIQCSEFSEVTRQNIFEKFWRLKWPEKKVFVKMLVDVKRPADTKNKQHDVSRRNKTLIFHLKKEELRIRVCKTMFLNTLGIKQWTVLHWVDEHKNEGNGDEKQRQKIKRHSEGRVQIKEFLNMLPKVESHYCRSSTTKLYLEPIWRSKTNVFREYEKYCIEKNIKSLKYKVFEDVFNELNLSIFMPKKDQCDICIGFSTSNVSKERYDLHQKRKTEARQEKEQDKLNEKFVYTMDLQAVLLCPVLKASAVYFKTKLTVHNFTIFNLKDKAGYCYLWDESEGSLNANEFASIICHFISSEVPFQAGDEIILFSDGCGYQNRNVTLANALLNLAIQNNITITQKILEKGHTQMECDSMHSTIERRLRNQDIYTPSGYIDACKHARVKPEPYHVQYLHYDFFRNYSQTVSCSFYKSLRPGSKTGDPVTTDIRAIRYCPNGNIYYKLNHSEDEWQILPQRRNTRANSCPNNEIPKAYQERLKIKREKWDHLQTLKGVLEHEHHNFYDSLPHH